MLHMQLNRPTFSRTDGVGDFALVIANILPLYGVDGEASAVLGQPPSLREPQVHAIEEPLDGNRACVAGQHHSILILCDGAIAG